MQTNFIEMPIGFADKHFDIIVAQGAFEYAGRHQSQKFAEIKALLKTNGHFVVSYVNFGHLHKYVSELYNNIQPVSSFRQSLGQVFRVDRVFPTSHHWHHHEPSRRIMKSIQMPIRMNIPVISPLFAVEYLFICSAHDSR
jgi:cyclopropane fatty-acyl-phospholipid synthase-like methyltransferase